MKGKPVTIALLVAVLMIWGGVIYRVVDATGGEEYTLPVAPRIAPMDTTQTAMDSFALVADYRDPFLGRFHREHRRRTTTAPVVKRQQPIKPAPKKEEPKPAPKINWAFLKYGGIFHNKKTGKITGMVRVHNKDFMVAEGDSVMQVAIKAIHRDSLVVEYKGEEKGIPKG